ncbi:MAG: uroporphyrinogen decarboxylase [Thiohalorhabdus sp.]|uniref:uroporphyrinogen decarboxylase n=1 Tax=Thiohalorhabdus sp. TaxID=3094134 RepID=UPI0039815AF0
MTRPENDTFLRACRREPTPYTPVWLMRQAGRYLPEYRRVREQAGDFMSLCRSPELATEVTLQPVDRLGVDAAILFSDILTIPAAMDRGLRFAPGEGPVIDHPVRSAADVDALPIPDPGGELRYVPDAVAAIRKALNNRVPLIGFAGSPWTLATYMVEGGSSKTYGTIKRLAYDEPAVLHRLLDKLAVAVTDYLNAQIEAGAQAVQIFDTWGGVLTPPAYREFSLTYMQRIVNGLRAVNDGERVPVILFTKGGGPWLEDLAATGADVLGLDWQTDPADARRRVGARVALQGNLDPTVLYARPERIEREVSRTLDAFGPEPGHVFNLGHGVNPDVPPEHAEAFVAAVHELSRRD